MNPETDPSTTPVYGVRPSKPGLYLGLFHGRDTPNQVMHGWGFDGPAIGPLRYFHTTYVCSVNVEFVSPTDAQLFTGTHDMQMDLAINGDLLSFDGKRVVPNLINCSTVERRFPHLELDDKNSVIDQNQYVDAFAQTRHDELKENRAPAFKGLQRWLQNLDL